jgi:hypothetical protein
VIQHGIDAEADEVWALGELRAWIDGQWIIRQQFGGQKIKRRKLDGKPTNLSDDHKGAATDAMKKCASMFGVGLYMMQSGASWHPGTPARAPRPGPQQAAARPAQRPPARSGAAPQLARAPQPEPAATLEEKMAGPPLHTLTSESRCQVLSCGQPLTEVTNPMGMQTKWTVAKLRYQGTRYHKMILCWTCYQEAEKRAKHRALPPEAAG